MACPVCGNNDAPAAQAGDVSVCRVCAETFIGNRKAVYADVHLLSTADMQRLREARTKVLAVKPR